MVKLAFISDEMIQLVDIFINIGNKKNMIGSRLIKILCLTLLLVQVVDALAEPVARRRDQFNKDYSYFIYPLAGEIPGLGNFHGIGTSVLNIGDTDADFFGFNVGGDIKAEGYSLLNYHLIENKLLFDLGLYKHDVTAIWYQRGIDSPKDQYYLVANEGHNALGQFTLTFDQRRLESYFRFAEGKGRNTKTTDQDLNQIAGSTDERRVGSWTLGGIADYTDDRLDPRQGYRLEAALMHGRRADPNDPNFYIANYNATLYVPVRKWDTFAFNTYYSRAHVREQGETDYNTLSQSPEFTCNGTCTPDANLINQRIAANQYGTAALLGGTQRLRSFSNYRFRAAQALFYGAEYRWNLTDEHRPFNLYFAKGIRTGIQLALFAEQGTVADESSQLFKNFKTSVGAGMRVVLTGVVIRMDFANGNEGSEFTVFIDYPWSMFSVDS